MLAHDAYGREGSPRIVLLHGWPLSRAVWSDVAPPVAGAGFRVLCPDLPGFGQSPALRGERWTVEGYAEAVLEFVRGTGADRAAVAGHSFGGYVALALAEQDRDGLSGLGLMSSRTLADSEAARMGRFTTIEKVRVQGASSLLPDLAAKLLAPDALAEMRDRAQHMIEACPPEAVVAGLAAMAARPDRTAVLESLPRPLLVLHGDADQIIPVSEAAHPAHPAGRIDRAILPGVGHMPMWEAPERTADAIASWARFAHAL